MGPLSKRLQEKIETLEVLVVDDDHYMRKVARTLLSAIGVKAIHEACDGMSGLDSIRAYQPDIVLVDWEMPEESGPQFVRMVRSPGHFPVPDVPIIVLSGQGERRQVVEAARLGAHEFLLKPVSAKTLRDRIVGILCKPRPTVSIGGYYGPAPRRLAAAGDRQDTIPVSPFETGQAR